MRVSRDSSGPQLNPGDAVSHIIAELEKTRRKRGESKADVARGAGKGEPAVRRLLSGRHANPTVKTLEAVAEHLGLRLVLEPQGPLRIAPTLEELRSKADAIEEIVISHGGRDVRIFGSVARGEARPDSDVDLLIEVSPSTGIFEIGAMEDELSRLLKHSVDVITSVHGRMQHIQDEAVPLR